MNYDMFYNKQSDDLDPNYIYPVPYIDPMMYINPYGMNNNFYPTMPMDANMAMNNYMTYTNPFMNNPFMCNLDDDVDDLGEDNEDIQMQQQMPNMLRGMMPNGMMQPCMPGMMFPYMMMPGMMPNMMFPYMMMPGMSPINMEEFDEEEM